MDFKRVGSLILARGYLLFIFSHCFDDKKLMRIGLDISGFRGHNLRQVFPRGELLPRIFVTDLV